MSETGVGIEELKPIDFPELGRMASASRWEKNPINNSNTVEYPLSKDPNPEVRIKAQGIQVIDEKGEVVKVQEETEVLINSLFTKLYEGDKENTRSKKEKATNSASKRLLLDLKTQDALMEPNDHQICGVVKHVGDRIRQAQEKFQSKGDLGKTTIKDMDYYVTKRDVINAFTFPEANTVFFEGEIFVMMNDYLKEIKGYGLSEDHIAMLLAHEVSHSDPDAKTTYLNEEYCDVQGLILAGEAGYNPNAAIDVEDFLIWLEETNEAVIGNDTGDKDKEYAIFPSHPNPRNRRQVLINILRDPTRVLPNQTKKMEAVDVGILADVSQEVVSWQEKQQNIILPLSDLDVVTNIANAKDISEILDALLGNSLLKQAEITKELITDKNFVNKVTLIQAITKEVEARLREDPNKYTRFYSNDEEAGKILRVKYDSGSVIIGGLSREIGQMPINLDIAKSIEEKKAKILLGLEEIDFRISTLPSTFDEDKIPEQKRQDKLEDFFEKNKLEKITQYIIKSQKELDASKIISGDFSQDETLSALLDGLKIKNFDNYINSLISTFKESTINERSKTKLCEKGKKLFLDQNLFKKESKDLSAEEVIKLLDSTLENRFSIHSGTILKMIAEKFGGGLLGVVHTTPDLENILDMQLHFISENLSNIKSEREITYMIMRSRIFEEYNYNKDISSGIVSAIDLSENIKNLRIAPAQGGEKLKHFLGGDFRQWNFSGTKLSEDLANKIGRRIDDLKLYHGNNISWSYYGQEINDLTKERCLELVSTRTNNTPTYGDKIYKDLYEKPIYPQETAFANAKDEFEFLKKLISVSGCEKEYLEKLIELDGIDSEEKAEYLSGEIFKGDMTLNELSSVFERNGWVRTPEDALINEIYYDIGINILRKLPSSGVLLINKEDEFVRNIYLAKYNSFLFRKYLEKKGVKFKDVLNTNYSVDDRELTAFDLYEGLNNVDRAKAELEDVFEFVKEGGIVKIDSLFYEYSDASWGEMDNFGANLSIARLIKAANYPTEYIEKKVDEVLAVNKDRYTQFEIDKWKSLIAFCQQPGFEIRKHDFLGMQTLLIKNGESLIEKDYKNVDDLLLMLDEVSKMPTCSYKDGAILCLSEVLINGLRNNPAASEYVFNKLINVLIKELSPKAYGIENDSYNFEKKHGLVFIPSSEGQIAEITNGLLCDSVVAAKLWKKLIGVRGERNTNTCFMAEYRKDSRFIGLEPLDIETKILYERLRILRQLPDCQLKEALAVFSLQTAYENMVKVGIDNSTGFKEELELMMKNEYFRFKEPQAKQKIFDTTIKLELGGNNGIVDKNSILNKFPDRQGFLDYITKRIPEKTAYRDKYVLMATEIYPFEVKDIEIFRNLLFSFDYGTQDKQVLYQRGGLELARIVKQDNDYSLAQARELMMWLIDEDLQAETFTELLTKINTTPAGRKLLDGALFDMGLLQEDESDYPNIWERRVRHLGASTAKEILVRLPIPIKKFVVLKIFKIAAGKNIDIDRVELQSLAKRSGMPTVVQTISRFVNMAFDSTIDDVEFSFNSLLDSTGFENPTTRSMFFDLMLGEKGLLENSIETNSDNFAERLGKNFNGNEMHKFIDQIVNLVVKKGSLNTKETQTMRVVAHSLLEGMTPTKRAVVLYNLLVGIKKIDFDQPDKGDLRSQILTTALGSFGVLGAKLGQTDEVIPNGWGSNISSLKHSTTPMPTLAVADIFSQEGLSPNYSILESVGAASTACGYMVRNPIGEKDFVKVVRPEVVLDWKEDFVAVNHMMHTLEKLGLVKFNADSVLGQIKKLVETELQTGKELDNLIQYQKAETEIDRQNRGGIRSVKMPLPRYDVSGNIVERPSNSLLIFVEPLGKEQGFIELSKIKSDPELSKTIDLNKVNTIVVNDFLYRSLVLGNWHADPHEGNIMVNKEGVVRKDITSEDLVWIDFGQVGTVEGDEKRANAARLLVGLGLDSRIEVAKSIFEGLEDKTGLTINVIDKELQTASSNLQEATLKVLAKRKSEEYMTNFLKATINILPYLKTLPRSSQFSLISPYIPQDMKNDIRVRLAQKVSGSVAA